MVSKLIHISKLGHVLKLYCQGQSKLHISTPTGLSRNTVKKYLHTFTVLKTTWEYNGKLSDKDLDEDSAHTDHFFREHVIISFRTSYQRRLPSIDHFRKSTQYCRYLKTKAKTFALFNDGS